ncbi:hypothetical protein [Rhodoflexus caldus]|uniref:hypothetical protein n=1 Tax=Rhodoflexus caldus TaxID=2891236 RepID=UPI00202A5A17|nr:hypothetical protein [Rhodoflexus caldus]
MQATDFSRFTLWEARFETNDLTPPPFSHYYHLIIRKEAAEYRATYELTYTHREEFTEEELAEEGFSPNDNRSCEAPLHEAWIAQLEKLMAQTQPETRPRKPAHNFLELHTVTLSGETQTFSPKNRMAWELLLQQVVQGLMETAKVEAPLVVGYNWQENGKQQRYDIRWQFADRTAMLMHAGATHAISWQAALAIMEQSFMIETDVEKAAPQPKSGDQISPGDGLWYPLLSGQQARWHSLKETITKLAR